MKTLKEMVACRVAEIRAMIAEYGMTEAQARISLDKQRAEIRKHIAMDAHKPGQCHYTEWDREGVELLALDEVLGR